KARREDHRRDALAREVEAETRRGLEPRRREALRRREVAVPAALLGPLVEPVEQAPELQVRHRAMAAQRARELSLAVRDADEAADELDAARRERVQIERRALGRPDELRRRHAPRADDVVDRVVALVENADGVEPPLNVEPAVDARQPDVLADCEDHPPPRALDLVRELQPGRRGADD